MLAACSASPACVARSAPPPQQRRSAPRGARALSSSQNNEARTVSCTTDSTAPSTTGHVRHASEQQQQGQQSWASSLRRAAAAAAAAVLTASAPAFAVENKEFFAFNGPFQGGLAEELIELQPDEIFKEDFTVKFAGLEVDHKDLVIALIVGQSIGFVGSLVGGNEARKRKIELDKLNAALIKVNGELRREMRVAGVGPYIPAPTERFLDKPLSTKTPEEQEYVDKVVVQLKKAKRLLKEGENADSLKLFQDALSLINSNPGALTNVWKAARKAHRGMGAALVKMGRFTEALKAMETVLRLSKEHDDFAGETDALGVLADIYTDLDRLEEAAAFYDRYFLCLEKGEDDRQVSASLSLDASEDFS